MLWTRQLGFEDGLDVTADNFGNVCIAGESFNNLNDLNSPYTRPFVAKVSPSGDVLWTQQYGDYIEGYAYSIATDGVGALYISGTGGTVSEDAFIAKIRDVPEPSAVALSVIALGVSCFASLWRRRPFRQTAFEPRFSYSRV